MGNSSSNVPTDLEEWEVLPKDDDPSKVSSGEVSDENSKGIVDDPSRILLESVEDISMVVEDQDEKIILEITGKVDQERMDSPLFPNKIEDDELHVSKENNEEEEEEEEEKKKNVKAEGMVVDKHFSSSHDKEKGFWNGIGFNVFGWRFSGMGMGTLCTIGVAAATICIFLLGTQTRQNQHHKIKFQIYSDDKSVKHMVDQTTRLNNAIAATKGVPMKRANITFGGDCAAA